MSVFPMNPKSVVECCLFRIRSNMRLIAHWLTPQLRPRLDSKVCCASAILYYLSAMVSESKAMTLSIV